MSTIIATERPTDRPHPLYPAPIAQHYETGGWKGENPGSCGVECACGVTFAGFDSLADAAECLARHIEGASQDRPADENRCRVPWCAMHLGDGEPTHLSDDATVTATAGGPAERREVLVSTERWDASSAVRLQNAGDAAMTADEALHLAGLLILAARRAQS